MLFSRRNTELNPVPGWNRSRGYEIHLPLRHRPEVAYPLVVVVHGFTHDSRVMRNITSPDGKPSHPHSLDSLADKEDFIVVYPNGTSLGILPGRCWNGGGGSNGFAPVAKKAVDRNVDDVLYLNQLLEQVKSEHRIDPRRIYMAGISNGGALVHRYATLSPGPLAAVAVVAGCNQYSAETGESPKEPVPLLHIHGTADIVWPYQGGPFAAMGLMESVESSVDTWIRANHAALSEEIVLDDLAENGMSVELKRYRGADSRSDVDLCTIVGGGHAWPGGHKFLPEKVIGKVHRRLSANQMIWDFFKNHPKSPD